MGGLAPLETLPNELLARICGELKTDKDDLMDLRLTSKALLPSATQALAQAHFATLSIYLTRNCLKLFKKICAHPLFGPCIRSIHIEHTRIDISEVVALGIAYDKTLADGDQLVSRTAKSYLNACSKRYSQEQYLVNPKDASKLLKQAFCLLKKHGRAVVFDVSDYCATASHDMQDYHKVGGHLWQSPDDHKAPFLTSTLHILLRAVYKTGLLVHGLHISYRNGTIEQLDEHSLSVESVRVSNSIYPKLKSINIEFGSIVYEGDSLRILTQFLSAAAHLETFTLNLLEEPEITGCIQMERFMFSNAILESVTSDKLTKVSLWNFSVMKSVLVGFLDRHRNTIHSIEVSCCCLMAKNWDETVLRIRNNIPHLQSLHLRELHYPIGLCSDHESCMLVQSVNIEEMEVNGLAKIQAWLDQVLTPEVQEV